MIPHVVSGSTISAYVNGKLHTFESTHPKFEEIKQALRAGADQRVVELIDLAETLRRLPYFDNGMIVVGQDQVTHNGTPIANYLVDVILRMAADKLPIDPWVRFLERMLQNPEKGVVADLYRFLEKSNMPITPDGFFLAYKKVQDDYTSFADATTRNDIGSSVFMPREGVDTNRHRTCSHGLHFCSWSYLPHYRGGQGKVVVLKVNPADVVAIPADYDDAKGRAWRYEVVDEVPEDDARFAFPHAVYEVIHTVEIDEVEPEDEPPVGLFGRLRAWGRNLLS